MTPSLESNYSLLKWVIGDLSKIDVQIVDGFRTVEIVWVVQNRCTQDDESSRSPDLLITPDHSVCHT